MGAIAAGSAWSWYLLRRQYEETARRRCQADELNRLRSLLDTAGDEWFWEADENLRITYFSPNFDILMERRHEDLTGRAVLDIPLQELQADNTLPLRLHAFPTRLRIDGPGEESIPVVIHLRQLRGENGRIRGYAGRARRDNRQGIRAAPSTQPRRRLADLLDSIDEGFAQFDPEGRLTRFNRHFSQIFSSQPETLAQGKTFGALVDAAVETGRIVMAGKQNRNIADGLKAFFSLETGICDIRLSDGRIFQLRISHDETHQAIVLSADVTELRRTADALRASEQRFRSLVHNTRSLVFYRKDQEGKGIIYGRDADEFFGVPGGSRIDTAEWHARIHEEDREHYLEMERERENNDREFTVEFRYRHPKSGEIRWARERAYVSYDPNNGKRYCDGYIIDISHEKKAAEMQERAREAAEMANRTKSEFLANMSHELRTPLNAIIGFSEIIRKEMFGPLEIPQYRDYVADIHDSARHLLDLIQDILDVSKAESGKLDMHETEFSPVHVATRTLKMVAERAQRAEIVLEDEIDLPEDIVLYGDELKIRQILLNLLSNAIKFTPNGGRVTLAASITGDGRMCFTVTDTGVGMRREDIPRAFQSFVQLPNSLSRNHAGTGLGLHLARVMARLHGGELTLESEIGVGTTALLYLPAERIRHHHARNAAALPAHRDEMPDLDILCIDDDPASARIIEAHIKTIAPGSRLRTAHTAEDGMAAALQQRPDVIFMDLKMPGTDGLTAVAHMAMNHLLRDIPVILCSAMELDQGSRSMLPDCVIGVLNKSDIGPATLKSALAPLLLGTDRQTGHRPLARLA